MHQNNSSAAGIRVVSFDLWLTLIKSNSTPNRASRAQSLYDEFNPGLPFPEFKRLVSEVEREADVLCETGVAHYGPYERTKMLADRVGKPMMSDERFKGFYDAQAMRLMEFPPELMQPEIPDVLRRLGERYDLALMSNTGFVNGNEMREALRRTGILQFFTYHLFSDEVGANKPNPLIFQRLLDLSKVEAAQVVHVGDNRRADYDGATSVGIQAVHVTSDQTIAQVVDFLL